MAERAFKFWVRTSLTVRGFFVPVILQSLGVLLYSSRDFTQPHPTYEADTLGTAIPHFL